MAYWQSEKTSLLSRTAFILNSKRFSDVRFFIGNPSVEYPAHKLLLSLASPVFEQQFNESVGEGITTISIPDIVPSAFYKMLEYIYTSTLVLNNVSDAFDGLVMAEKFKIDDLQRQCQKYINCIYIDPKKACRKYELANKFKNSNLSKLCLYTFMKHTEAVFDSDGFLQAKLSTVEVIIQNDFLSCDEITVLEAVMKWGATKCRRKGVVDSSINIRNFIEPLMKYLRFLTLSIQEFHIFLSEYEILTSNEVFAITMKLTQPLICMQFPSSLCQNTSRRCRTSPSGQSVATLPKKLNHILLSSANKKGNENGDVLCSDERKNMVVNVCQNTIGKSTACILQSNHNVCLKKTERISTVTVEKISLTKETGSSECKSYPGAALSYSSSETDSYNNTMDAYSKQEVIDAKILNGIRIADIDKEMMKKGIKTIGLHVFALLLLLLAIYFNYYFV